jgi:hypothetical protein
LIPSDGHSSSGIVTPNAAVLIRFGESHVCRKKKGKGDIKKANI